MLWKTHFPKQFSVEKRLLLLIKKYVAGASFAYSSPAHVLVHVYGLAAVLILNKLSGVEIKFSSMAACTALNLFLHF